MSDEEEPKTRSAAEIVRMRHAIARMRWMLQGLESAITQGNTPLGNDTAGAITQQALEIALQVAKHDAYLLAEDDAKKELLADLLTDKETSANARAIVDLLKKKGVKFPPEGG